MSAFTVLTVKLSKMELQEVNKYLGLRRAENPAHFDRTPQDILLATPFMDGIREQSADLKRRIAA